MKPLKISAICLVALGLMSATNLHAVIYSDGNPGDWSDSVTGSSTGGPGNGGYTTIYNVPDAYQSPGYGSGPYSLFGAGLNTSQPFQQSVAVYIDAGWPAPNPSYAQSFWIDMAANSSSSDLNNYLGTEHNFRLTANGSAVTISVDGQGTPISTITSSGWYDFQMTYGPGANGADPVVTDMNIFSMDGSGNLGARIGTTTVLGNSDGEVTTGNDLSGSGYLWFTVWANGSAGNQLNIADVEATTLDSTAVPESKPIYAGALMLIPLAATGLRILRKKQA